MRAIDYAEVRRRIPLALVLQHLAWAPSRMEGAYMRGWCPLHRQWPTYSRTFRVSYNGLWFCGKCQIGGDTLALWSLFVRQELYPATLLLCEQLNIPVPYLPRRKRPRAPRSGKLAP